MFSLSQSRAPVGAVAVLCGFRDESYRCLSSRADALFEWVGSLRTGPHRLDSGPALLVAVPLAQLDGFRPSVDRYRRARGSGDSSARITLGKIVDVADWRGWCSGCCWLSDGGVGGGFHAEAGVVVGAG
jgi:hypothetical protein